MTLALCQFAFAVGLLLRRTSATPLRVVIAPHGRPLASARSGLIRSTAAPDASEITAVDSSSRDRCPSHGYAGGQLRRARSAWSGRRLGPRATLEWPADNATAAYAVRGGQLFRRQRPRKRSEKSAESGGFADDNVFIEALLWRTLRRFPSVPDADLVLSYGDTETRQSAAIQAPVFAFSPRWGHREENESDPARRHPDAIGFPNPYLVDQALSLSERTSSRGGAAAEVSWASKRSKAFWRGTLTGSNNLTSIEEALAEGRVRLAAIAAKQPQDFDIAYTDIDLKETWSQPVKSEMLRAYSGINHTSQVDFFEVLPEYKYLVNVDGVSAAWRGLPLLASGSLMLLQAGERGEFFLDDLTPWVHYVPIKRDLSDLPETLRNLRAHDETAFRIAKAGQEFALRNLTLPALECYCLEALHFMAKVVDPLPVADLRSKYGFALVPEPDAHLQTPPLADGQ